MDVDLCALEQFLSTMTVSNEHILYKDPAFEEENFYGVLNPAQLLDQLFWTEQDWQHLDFPDFVAYYWQRNEEVLLQRFGDHYERLGHELFLRHLAARFYRTQFTILTENHAAVLADQIFRERGYAVKRSLELDRSGVDFVVLGFDDAYNIHIFTDNKRGWEKRQIKRRDRCSDHIPGIHLDFPYKPVAGPCLNNVQMLPNGFGIYRREYVKHLGSVLYSGKAKGRQLPRVDCQTGLVFEAN